MNFFIRYISNGNHWRGIDVRARLSSIERSSNVSIAREKKLKMNFRGEWYAVRCWYWYPNKEYILLNANARHVRTVEVAAQAKKNWLTILKPTTNEKNDTAYYASFA